MNDGGNAVAAGVKLMGTESVLVGYTKSRVAVGVGETASVALSSEEGRCVGTATVTTSNGSVAVGVSVKVGVTVGVAVSVAIAFGV